MENYMFQDMSKDFDIKKIRRSNTISESNCEPHVHPFHEIFYLSSGECTSFIDHNIYKFGKGDLVIVPGGCLHKTVYTGKGIHERIVISFRQEITDWIKEQIGAEYLKNCMVPGVINIPEKRRNYVDSLLDKLMFENDTPDILSTAFIKAGLVELLLFIIRCKEYEDNVIKEIDVDNRKIQEVATYIFEHYTRLTLNLQASKSSKYIISIQRESTGIRTLRNCQPAVFIKITVRIHLAGPVKKNQITVHTKRRVFLQKFLKLLRHHWLTFPCQIQDHTELIFIFSKQLLIPL